MSILTESITGKSHGMRTGMPTGVGSVYRGFYKALKEREVEHRWLKNV